MSGIGHNSGREAATGWRLHCWREARRALLPSLPLEIIRLRVARARELGLDYSTYASVRATSGHDIIAFLFSTNALRLVKAEDRLPPSRAAKLADLRGCSRIAIAHPPLPEALAAALAAAAPPPLDAVAPAPAPFASWSETRRAIRVALDRTPPDCVLLVGDTALEREWSAAGRLAGYLPAERYFPAS